MLILIQQEHIAQKVVQYYQQRIEVTCVLSDRRSFLARRELHGHGHGDREGLLCQADPGRVGQHRGVHLQAAGGRALAGSVRTAAGQPEALCLGGQQGRGRQRQHDEVHAAEGTVPDGEGRVPERPAGGCDAVLLDAAVEEVRQSQQQRGVPVPLAVQEVRLGHLRAIA